MTHDDQTLPLFIHFFFYCMNTYLRWVKRMLIDSKRKMKEIMRLINSMSGSVSVGRTKAKAQGSGLRCWGYSTWLSWVNNNMAAVWRTSFLIMLHYYWYTSACFRDSNEIERWRGTEWREESNHHLESLSSPLDLSRHSTSHWSLSSGAEHGPSPSSWHLAAGFGGGGMFCCAPGHAAWGRGRGLGKWEMGIESTFLW